MPDRRDPDVELLWQEFHQLVNMTSEELRAWLLTQAAGESGFGPDPDLGLPDLGRSVLHILTKRKVDLTPADTDVMRRVVDFVEDRLAGAPADAAEDGPWRRSLMCVGHDPLRPSTIQR